MTAPRARDIGIPFEGTPGPHDAITDVAGVEVGHTTLIQGDSIRTGVTVVFARGKEDLAPCFGGFFSLNGNGEMTGTHWVEESGLVESPIALTNTHSVGVVHHAIVEWLVEKHRDRADPWWALPIVAETFDGLLNDVNGQHVKPAHVRAAIEAARGGPLLEGAVGGGTGMICHEFKGGIGSASRELSPAEGGYTVGVLVQANYGLRDLLTIAGVPVGRAIPEGRQIAQDTGSIVVLVATDAPLLPHQLERLARRAPLGLARVGSISGNGSGDLFLAFSTANRGVDAKGPGTVTLLPNTALDPLFLATVQSVEEAIVNALVAGRTMTGKGGRTVLGLPHDRVREVLREHRRLR